MLSVSLFGQLDNKMTKENAKKVLENYRLLKKIAGETFTSKVTAMYSFEPRSHTNVVSKPIENHIVRQETARREAELIELAISRMLDVEERRILIGKYCSFPVMTDKELYLDSGLDDATFYRRWELALFSFAELYKAGELLVFVDGSTIHDYFESKL